MVFLSHSLFLILAFPLFSTIFLINLISLLQLFDFLSSHPISPHPSNTPVLHPLWITGLYRTNCAIRWSAPNQIPAAVDTLRNLEPDPGPVGIHPVSPGSTQENLPPFRHASGLHHELVPVFQRHRPQVHSPLARERSGLGWLRRDGQIKCHIYTEGASSLSVIGRIWADVAADWLVSSGVVRCDWLCFQPCDQDKMQDCWLSDYFIALTCSAVLAMTLWYRGKYKESALAVFNHIHISAETDLSHIHALLYTWPAPSSAFMIFEFQTLFQSSYWGTLWSFRQFF